MSTGNSVRLELAGGHATIVFDRPEARNALSSAMMGEFEDAVSGVEAWVAADARAVAVLLTSSDPRVFLAGADLKELRLLHGYDGGRAFADRGRRLLARLEALPVPVVAVLEGPALGGGAEVSLAADIRVMAETSYFSFVQAKVGIIPGWGGGRRLAGIVGWKRALCLFATAARLDASEAARSGLADLVVPAGAALGGALDMVAQMEVLPPLAVRALKPLLRAAVGRPDADADEEGDIFGHLWASDDHEEAIAALLERRIGRFEGR